MESTCCRLTLKAVDVLFHCLDGTRNVGVTIGVQRPVVDKQITCKWTEVTKTLACCSGGAGVPRGRWGVHFSSLLRGISCRMV